MEALSESAIHYKVTLSCKESLPSEEMDLMAKGVLKYFVSKCEKIRMILRSAVGGTDRNLKLTFEVVDKIKPMIKYYKIIHETPENVKMEIDNQEMSWLELLEKAQ